MWKTVTDFIQANTGKMAFLAVVIIAAIVITKILCKAARLALEKTDIPNASIFLNLIKVAVWSLAVAIALQPVFGINPTTVITALGIGGVAVSLGLKDTVSNVIGGFGLMAGKVVQPGDTVKINGVEGTVTDLTWRHTTILERNGNSLVVPNNVLNTTALEKTTVDMDSSTSVQFIVGKDVDFDYVRKTIIDTVTPCVEECALEGSKVSVTFSGIGSDGVHGTVWLHAKNGVLPSTIEDKATIALAKLPFVRAKAMVEIV